MKIYLLAGVLCASPMSACINDRDTLAAEIRAQKGDGNGLPPVVRAITGHFERNPALYYAMRLKRVKSELQRNPKRLDLYDDAGAASDRLGRSDEALLWMEKKKRQLATSVLDLKTRREHEYRYLANAGTFHAHLWLRQGANRRDMARLKTGRDMIARAVKLKPKAHFGREKYQLLLMEWVLNPPALKRNVTRRDFLNLSALNQDDGENHLKDSKHSDALTGLFGLIVLGDAWASFDVYHALMQGLGAQGNATLCIFAGQRVRELLDNGRKSLNPNPSEENWPLRWSLNFPQSLESEDDIRRKYFELRADAMAFQDARDLYMLQRLQKGQHPDTHPNFWAGWKAPPTPDFALPDLQKENLQRQIAVWTRRAEIVGVCLMLTLIGGLGFWLGKRVKPI
jgi:hypothetical protein